MSATLCPGSRCSAWITLSGICHASRAGSSKLLANCSGLSNRCSIWSPCDISCGAAGCGGCAHSPSVAISRTVKYLLGMVASLNVILSQCLDAQIARASTSLFHSWLPAGPKQIVGGCQHIPSQSFGKGRRFHQVIANHCRGFRRSLIAEHSLGPAGRKKDISRTLDFGQEFEAGADEFPRLLLTQRVVEISERFKRPRLMPAILDVAQPQKSLFADGRIGG